MSFASWFASRGRFGARAIVLLMRVLVMFVWWKEMTNLVAALVPSPVRQSC